MARIGMGHGALTSLNRPWTFAALKSRISGAKRARNHAFFRVCATLRVCNGNRPVNEREGKWKRVKGLMEMGKEELWQLFPIFLTAHRADWAGWFALEAALLGEILPAGQVKRISHVGSTAIPTIWAKPIVDILVEAMDGDGMEGMARTLAGRGYLCMSQGEGRISFNKGYTPSGFAPRVFHLHLRRAGDNGELYFRDYLLAHPGTAKEYEALKLGLWKRFEHDRDGYTQGKTEFVEKYTARAREEFAHRYGI